MRRVVPGSGFGVAFQQAPNTPLAVLGSEHGILMDCSMPSHDRFRRLRVEPELTRHAVITYFHPDPGAGLPSFVMGLWLQAR